MPGYIMHVGATMACPHQSPVAVPPSHGVNPARVLLNFYVSPLPVAVMNPPFPVPACTFNQKKCTSVQWTMASTRVFVVGRPLMLQSAPGAPGGGVLGLGPSLFPAVGREAPGDQGGGDVNAAFPLTFDAQGRTSGVDSARHIRDMVELLLFTSPGERVNRPDFGCGLQDLMFAAN